jgi:hypothetical protein
MSLEKEFKKVQKLALKEISLKLKEAQKALDEAESISEKYGISFYSNVSPLGQSYRPSSFESKWGKLLDKMEEYDELPEHEGWQHSSVC